MVWRNDEWETRDGKISKVANISTGVVADKPYRNSTVRSAGGFEPHAPASHCSSPKYFTTHHHHIQRILLDVISPEIMGREEQAEEREVLDSIFPEEITGTATYSACQS